MPRKTLAVIKRKEARESWAAVGVDTSLTSIAACAIGFDARTNKMVGPVTGEIRWTPEVDYFERLRQAARGENLILDLLRVLWVVSPERVFIALEEPVHYGAIQRGIASFAKQQIQVNGAFVGALARYGFKNIVEINNSQWKKTIRKDGFEFEVVPRKASSTEKNRIKTANKFVVKEWAIKYLGLPEFPDLVASKSGAKIPRPESGFGANAKAVQADDRYDSAAVMSWMVDHLEENGVIE